MHVDSHSKPNRQTEGCDVKFRKTIIAAALTLVAAGFTGTAAAKETPADVIDKVMYYKLHTNATSASCKSEHALRTLSGDHSKGVSYGITNIYPGIVVFNKTKVCSPFAAYWGGAPLNAKRLNAVLTIAHESAHLRGIRNEAAAECAGVRGALRILKAGREKPYMLRVARRTLLVEFEPYRPPAYKLRGRCAVLLRHGHNIA
jgi:hypothetical protein